MVSVKKKTVDSRVYYYLGHSFRKHGKVENRERYLGKEMPANLDEIKEEFMSTIFRERWFDHFDNIKSAYANHRKAIPPTARAKEMEAFSIKYTYNTNRIEGSTLTFRETALLLEKGITPSSRPISDVKEADTHISAFNEMLEYKRDLSMNTVLYFHKKLFEETKKDIAGNLRKHQVEISGSKFKPPLAVEVYPLMEEFMKWYKKNTSSQHPVHLAALVHLKLVTIHPFTDGNGRISRLMMNFVLDRHGFPMYDISYNNRNSYYNALERSQVNNDENIFLQWFFRRYMKENNKYLDSGSRD